MPLSAATITVPHPARYLGLLTSRLEHEASVERAPDGRATITFGQGTCVLTPARGLHVIAAASDAVALAGVQDILTRQLRQTAADAADDDEDEDEHEHEDVVTTWKG